MSYTLLIVESPVKAKTIERYLGDDYRVISCNGHIRDFPKNKFAIDIHNNFTPTYTIGEEKKSLVLALQRASTKASQVLLATDDDREGEAISWHLQQILNLKEGLPNRIFFREITKKAIVEAIQHPRPIDMEKVNAQQARRTLDRIVGYDISPILWKKIKPGLSAGRVQSVAVKLIAERERSIHKFVAESNYRVTAELSLKNKQTIQAELKHRLGSDKEVIGLLEACKNAKCTVKEVTTTLSTRTPSAPFTTSTLQQYANQRLGFSVNTTMVLSQRLYEQGYITYMRTDDTRLAKEAMVQAEKVVVSSYGKTYHQERSYSTKKARAQQAHEAIRPTQLDRKNVSQDASLQKLYKIIWQRTIASQMAPAKIAKKTVIIALSTSDQTLVTKTDQIVFNGFLAAYDQEKESIDKSTILQQGEELALDYIQARQTFSSPPARYTEASLVKRLEEEGIGRPSTYAPTISTIQKRGYVHKDTRPGTLRKYQLFTLNKGKVVQLQKEEMANAAKNKLFPTDTALVVIDFLDHHFTDIVNYQFTAKIEDQLDDIAQKKLSWKTMLATFYQDFDPLVKKATTTEEELPTLHHLGKDPKTGKPVIARLSRRYGPLVQLGGMNDEEKPRFASLPKGVFLEHITLQQALKLLELPREVGVFEATPIIAQIGRYGPYLKHKEKFYSLSKEYNPHTITLKEAIPLIQTMREEEAKKIIKTFPTHPDIQVRQGRWGAYLKTAEGNVKIPKDKEPSTLSIKECLTIIEEAPKKKKRKRISVKKS